MKSEERAAENTKMFLADVANKAAAGKRYSVGHRPINNRDHQQFESQLVVGKKFHSLDLRGTDLRGFVFRCCSFHGTDFRKANLDYCAFEMCNISEAEFGGASLCLTSFRLCELHWTLWDGNNIGVLDNTNAGPAKMRHTFFTQCMLKEQFNSHGWSKADFTLCNSDGSVNPANAIVYGEDSLKYAITRKMRERMTRT